MPKESILIAAACAIALLSGSTAFAATVEQLAILAKGRAALETLAENRLPGLGVGITTSGGGDPDSKIARVTLP